MKKISIIFGTRPEAIKLIPVILELKKTQLFEVNICCTAQHREMVDQILNVFKIKPDIDMNVMKQNQSLSTLTSNIIVEIDKYFQDYKPDIVLVQGDTTTVMAVSLVAFYHKIKIGHVEAGLRTFNRFSPFPEEVNRTITSRLSDLHFSPTERAKNNLLEEGIRSDSIFITGNTVIDTLIIASSKVDNSISIDSNTRGHLKIRDLEPFILITGHRRENFGKGFENICQSIVKLSERYEKFNFIYPVHLNPNVQEPVKRILSKRKNIYLIEPQSYLTFVALMKSSYLILTDSGGVQEEAPSLGKPVLVMRENTERPEAIEAGTAILVGTDSNSISKNVIELLENESSYKQMASKINPYGDGQASKRIIEILKNSL